MPFKKPLLVCIVGATAIGKTSLAIKVANAFSTEIISADSRQFYKEMSIGTAVPTAEELAAAPHHFIQNKSIFEDYSVGDFEREALLKLDQLFQKHQIVVMVGGSGLYVDAVVKGLDSFPTVPSAIRESLNKDLKEKGIEVLQRELAQADPEYFLKVDSSNPHRLIRALEIFRSTGNPYSSYLNKNNGERKFNTIFIGLTAEREIIYNRINMRVDNMIADGLLEEAEKLAPYKDLNALQTVGYREMFQHFEGILTKEQAIEEIKKNTRRFAKRQGTWFRKNDAIEWFTYTSEPSEIVSYINEKNAF